MRKFELYSLRLKPTEKKLVMKGNDAISAVKKMATRLFRDKRRKGPFELSVKEKKGDKVYSYLVDKKEVNKKVKINGKTILYRFKILAKAI
jgi:hypothetical protein|tara:strand:- start:337 stop:609 length:273 start_codon:yes stop_codon:yes gene_type:complete